MGCDIHVAIYVYINGKQYELRTKDSYLDVRSYSYFSILNGVRYKLEPLKWCEWNEEEML